MESSIKNTRFSRQTLAFTSVLSFLLFLTYTNDSKALEGDELIVIESLVNVRSGPTTESESLVRLKEGRKVIEIQRKNNWIEVETNREDYPTGWIHKTLLSKINVSKNTTSPTRFENFLRRFNDQIEVDKNENGIVYFTEARNKGKGEIEVVATDDWINGDVEMKNNTLSVIFKIWSDVTPVGQSISVQVVDGQGQRYTVMLR